MTIISHKYRFILIKPRKTAGTTVEIFLSQFLGNKDIICQIGAESIKQANKKFLKPQNHLKKQYLPPYKLLSRLIFNTKQFLKLFIPNYRKRVYFLPIRKYLLSSHADYQSIRELVGDDIINYTIVSILRNPIEQFLSYYNFYKLTDDIPIDKFITAKSKLFFSELIEQYFYRNKLIVDFWIDNKNLEKTIDEFLRLKKIKYKITTDDLILSSAHIFKNKKLLRTNLNEKEINLILDNSSLYFRLMKKNGIIFDENFDPIKTRIR